MSNQAKGARLWLRPAREGRPAVWIIRDGVVQRSTGCAADEVGRAEQCLARYVGKKHAPPTDTRDPAAVEVSDVLDLYVGAKKVARPRALLQRVGFLNEFFGSHKLAQVNGELCRAYAAQRTSEQAARRELEDFRAAIRYHWKQGRCTYETRVEMPDKAIPRERWLTRSEAARLIWGAWRYRQPQREVLTERRMRRHVARFVLVGLYTGTRASAICTASFEPEEGRGRVDLERGVFYRQPKGKRRTNKLQPTIRLPPRLLAHMRRWKDRGLCKHSVIEFDDQPVASIKKAFGNAVADAGLADVTQHTLRHTAITWAMQNGADIYQAAGFFGVSPKLIVDVYGHHHPDYQSGVLAAVTARPNTVTATGSPQVERNKTRRTGPNLTGDVNNIKDL